MGLKGRREECEECERLRESRGGEDGFILSGPVHSPSIQARGSALEQQ